MITVVIPAYNPGEDLIRALVSLRAQSYEDWQCIVVDDGSHTPVEALLEPFRDPRIRLIRHPVNRGRGAARATGLGAVVTPFVAWLDADDWMYSDRLRRQLTAMEANPGVDFVYGGTMFVAPNERPIGTAAGITSGEPRSLQGRELPGPIHATLLFRARVLQHVQYSGDFRVAEDHAFLMVALREFKFKELPEIVYVYREDQSRSLRKYLDSTVTRLRVAPRIPASRADRVALAATYLAKLAAVASLSAVGQRRLLDGNYRSSPTPDQIAEYDHQVALQAGASDPLANSSPGDHSPARNSR